MFKDTKARKQILETQNQLMRVVTLVTNLINDFNKIEIDQIFIKEKLKKFETEDDLNHSNLRNIIANTKTIPMKESQQKAKRGRPRKYNT